MRFLTETECVAWCEPRGYRTTRTIHGHQVPSFGDPWSLREVPHPVDSGKKVAMARIVVDWALASGACLIWITEYGVWPSSEHRPLYDRFREAPGRPRRARRSERPSRGGPRRR